MASELTLTISGSFTKNGVTVTLPGVTASPINVAGGNLVLDVLTVNNTDTTISLGGMSGTLGWAFFKNLDASIAISIRIAAAGTKIVRLLAGEAACFRIDSGITAPVAIADSGTPLLFYGLLLT